MMNSTFLLTMAAAVALAGRPAQDGTEDKPSSPARLPITIAKKIVVGGLELQPASPPRGLRTDAALGMILNQSMQASVIHYIPGYRADVMRAVKTPGGDYLAVVLAGEGFTGGKGHYAPAKIDYSIKANDLLAYRSSDKGRTWSGPKVLFPVSYSMHGFIPLVPRDSRRIYCFGTEPVPELREGRENAPIAFRWSDDDGHTWSPPTLIRAQNDPHFKGMSCLNMTETTSGVWLLGSHSADWSTPSSEKLGEWSNLKKGRLATRQYLLRSEDQGTTWTVLPGPRPNGWCAADYDRMDEARPLALDGKDVLTLARTPEGHLWGLRSHDDGQTWSAPKPTCIVHPDAPPMLFTLSDGKTLICLHHNNYDPENPHFGGQTRNQLWCTLSTDAGRTWSEPRFLMASVNENRKEQISYVDLLADDGHLHLFVPYGWKQTLYVQLRESDLLKLPTKAELAATVPEVKDAGTSSPAESTQSATAKTSRRTPNYASQIAAKLEPTRRLIYKNVNGRPLQLDLFEPPALKSGDRRPCFVAYHGGGWTAGSARTMYPFTAHCAGLGMVAISVEYRLYKPGTDVTVFDCVKDARSAMRHVRSHAAELGIDPQKIVVNGASAGGHLAAATAMFPVDEVGEDTSVSCMPNAMVLFSPVIDTSKEGYGNAKVGQQWKELSPAHQVRRGLPSTLVFHGTADTTTPFAGAKLFHEAMLQARNRSELVAVEGSQHTYMFKDAAQYADTLRRMDDFFTTIHFLPVGTP